MDVSAVKNHIKTKKLNDFYIFTGPEWAVQKIYINQIASASGKEVCYIDSLSDVWHQIVNKSFISTSKCYVVRDDADLMTSSELQDRIKSGALEDNIVVFLLTSVDKRTKFYKTYKDTIVEFEPLKTQILMKYIKNIVPALTDKNCQVLIDICEHDYGRILLELDKVTRYYEDSSTSVNAAFEALLQDGTIYEPPYDAIFDFVDAVLKRQVNRAFHLLRQSYDSGEATMVLLSVLYDNTKALLQVQSYSGDNLASATGLNGWQIKNAKSRGRHYSNRELVNLLKLIQECDAGIKSGTIDESVVMEYILVRTL